MALALHTHWQPSEIDRLTVQDFADYHKILVKALSKHG